MHDMMMAALKGDEAEAMRINKMLEEIHTNIFCESNPIPAKWAMKRLGKIDNDYCRPPMMALDEQYYSVVEGVMKKAGLI
jgi:4-hydroxy-tetrahydrodipicolinate synthase